MMSQPTDTASTRLPWTLEDRMRRIDERGVRIDKQLKSMRQLASVDGASKPSGSTEPTENKNPARNDQPG